MLVIFAMFVLVTFLITVVTRRAYRTTALVVGSIPFAIVALENLAELLNPLAWVVLLPILAFGILGSLTGAWLAQLVHARWRRA
ncbi:MAG TPA: hypothetical protein VEW25_14165 [Allosphingosinicella sp.]|nr:hypothetical protein [Allosphingosinicella sp.]